MMFAAKSGLRLSPRIWAGLSYLGVVPMVASYVVGRKNTFVRYHLRQALALILFKILNSSILLAFLKLSANGFGNQGIILLDVFLILGLMLNGAYNALQGRLVPLPVLGEPLARIMVGLLNRIRVELEATLRSL
jgi:uncharacterized membrane protein